MNDRFRDRPPRRDRDDDTPAEPDPGRLSRLLALVLRHRAYQFDLRLDDEGFADFDELMEVIEEQRNLTWVTRDDIQQLLDAQDRKRFELTDDNRIRATYGHSFRKPIRYKSITPPELLYIGMSQGQATEARTAGIKPTGRQYVHLSADKDAALELAKLHDPNSTLVTVQAKSASENGIQFHEPAEGLYLTARVPAEYVVVEVKYGRSGKRSRSRF